MRKITVLTIVLLISFILSSCSSSHSLSSFQEETNEDFNIDINAPKWLVMMFIPKDEKQELKKFTKGIRKVKLLSSEESRSTSLAESLDQFTKEHNFKPYMYIKEDGSKVNLYAKTKDDYISEILLSVDDDDTNVLIGLLGKMRISTFEKALAKEMASN